MFRLKTYDEKEIEDTFAGTLQGIEPCDVCGDDLGVHERLVVEFDLDTDRPGAGHKLDPQPNGEQPEEQVVINSYRVVGCDRQPRTWRMWARRQERLTEVREFLSFGSEHHVKRGWTGIGTPTEVELTEDPDGLYWGWIRCDSDTGHAGEPIMIQPGRAPFNVQFHYGPEKEAGWGRGEIVRLSVKAAA